MGRNVSTVMTGLLSALVFGLAGCGGGGGSDANSGYKGNVTQATVTAGNAKAVSVDAVDGVQNVAAVGVLKSAAGTAENTPLIQSVARIFENSVSRISPKAVVAKTAADVVQGTEFGFSGFYSYAANGNQTTGAVSGTITFTAYKEFSYSPVISGTISFSALANTTTGNLINASISFSSVTIATAAQSSTINGSISMSITATSSTLNISAVRLDNATSNTYWAKDFSFVLTGNTMTINGTYFDHVHGYVVVTTVTPLTVSAYSSTPTAGKLLFTGSRGTKALLTYTISGYILEVDTTGNNSFVLVP